MFAPLAVSALGLAAGRGRRSRASALRAGARGAYALALAVGAARLGFHVYNVCGGPAA